ncbi:MAG: caspase family protein [bacterium]
MRRLLLALVAGALALLMFGCSDNPTTSSGIDNVPDAELVQRPQFVDTRPQAEILAHTLTADPTSALYKKPPPPPPDTGSKVDPNPNPAHKYAYVVGISDYEGTANDLNYCDDDAQEMKSYFQSQGFTVRMDLDRNATADNIEAGLQWLVANASPGDEIAFSYSGHGDDPVPYGSCLISTDLWYLTHGFVMQYFNAANCTKKMAAIDACMIGDFHDDCVAGTHMATASDNTYSYDAPGLQNGAWTYYWIQGTGTSVFEEDIAAYALAGMKAWAKTYHVRVSPKNTDMYTGWFDI